MLIVTLVSYIKLAICLIVICQLSLIFIWLLMTWLFTIQIFFIPCVFVEWVMGFGIIRNLFGLLCACSVALCSLDSVCCSATPGRTISQFDGLSLWVHFRVISVHV